MDKRIQDTFDALRTPERLKRKTKAALRKATFDYGRNRYRLRQRQHRLALAALSLALLLTGTGLWFLPAASIAVDINPSVELKVNSFDKVISLKGRNSDGVKAVKDIDVGGMEYDDAIQRILLSRSIQPFLEEGGDVTITVAGGISEEHAGEMLNRVLCRAYNIAKEEHVLYCRVDWRTVRAAREAGLCIPRYLAWQKLKEADPDITAEDIRQIPREEIRSLTQGVPIEDPCHQ